LPQHPGEYIRETVPLPQKIKVTDAAKLLGVGRPALSNFLNGNAAASPEMSGGWRPIRPFAASEEHVRALAYAGWSYTAQSDTAVHGECEYRGVAKL
jgi:predicted transcriptional regulator